MNTAIEVDLNKRHLCFGEMAHLQNILNQKADKNNPDWMIVRTREDFALAATLEAAEMADTYNWKWWKAAGEIDKWNIKIEAIDMLHFLLSIAIINGVSAEEYYQSIADTEADLDTDEDYDSGSELRNKLFQIMTNVNQSLYDDNFYVLQDLFRFVGMTEEEVAAVYISKYTLNSFRWNNSYGATYKKVKASGLEDNHMLEQVRDKFMDDLDMTLADIPNMVIKIMEDFQASLTDAE